MSETRWDFLNITGAATTVVKAGWCVFGGIIFNKCAASSVVTIYDNTAASGTKIATITNPLALLASQTPLLYNCRCTNGITVVTSGTDDITVLFL